MRDEELAQKEEEMIDAAAVWLLSWQDWRGWKDRDGHKKRRIEGPARRRAAVFSGEMRPATGVSLRSLAVHAYGFAFIQVNLLQNRIIYRIYVRQ